MRKRANVIESDEVSEIPYFVFEAKDVENGGDNTISMWFPKQRTIFSCTFSSEGKTALVNAQRWWVSPATKDQSEREFVEAKKAALRVVAEAVSSQILPKE